MDITRVACVAFTALMASFFTQASVRSEWFMKVRPEWTPPGWVFGAVWTVLYIGMAAAFVRMQGRMADWMAVNLILNVAWCYWFFFRRSVAVALFVMVALLVNVGGMLYFSWGEKDIVVKTVLALYMGWLVFAFNLNYASRLRLAEHI